MVHYFAINWIDVGGVSESFMDFFLIGPESKINFSLEEFNLFLTSAITVGIWIGAVALVDVSWRAILRYFFSLSLSLSLF